MENRKCILITGAVRNTGLAIAKRFLSEGWAVFITSRNTIDAKKKAEELSRTYLSPCFGLGYSPLKDKNEIGELFKTIAEKGYIIDSLVCAAAALGLSQNSLNCDPEEWENVFFTNMTGYFSIAQFAAKEMIRSGKAKTGTIVLIDSINYRNAIPARSAYIASKGGILSLSKALAVDLAPYGIRVNCVIPGPIWTTRYDSDPQKAAKKAKPIPLGRVSTGDEIAEAVFFLSTEKSGNMTGDGMIIDGGLDCIRPE